MPIHKENSAARLASLMRTLSQQNRAASALDGWSVAFAIPVELDGVQRLREVGDLLSAFSLELALTRTALIESGIPEELYSRHVDRVNNGISVAHAPSALDGILKSYFLEDTLVAFEWMAYVLPHEQTSVSTEDVNELVDLISKVELLLAEEKLPPSLASLLQKQVDSMKRALALNLVQGVKSVRTSTRAFMADLTVDQEEIRTATESLAPEVASKVEGTVRALWRKGADVCDDLDKYRNGAGVLVTAGGYIGKLLAGG